MRIFIIYNRCCLLLSAKGECNFNSVIILKNSSFFYVRQARTPTFCLIGAVLLIKVEEHLTDKLCNKPRFLSVQIQAPRPNEGGRLPAVEGSQRRSGALPDRMYYPTVGVLNLRRSQLAQRKYPRPSHPSVEGAVLILFQREKYDSPSADGEIPLRYIM